jgi:UDP-galactopyranose mutase
LARIADDPLDFVAAVEAALLEDRAERLRDVDTFLTQTSWDGTWTRMYGLVAAAIADHDADVTAVSLPAVAPDVA